MVIFFFQTGLKTIPSLQKLHPSMMDIPSIQGKLRHSFWGVPGTCDSSAGMRQRMFHDELTNGSKFLAILDPFEARNLCRGLSQGSWNRIRDALRRAADWARSEN